MFCYANDCKECKKKFKTCEESFHCSKKCTRPTAFEVSDGKYEDILHVRQMSSFCKSCYNNFYKTKDGLKLCDWCSRRICFECASSYTKLKNQGTKLWKCSDGLKRCYHCISEKGIVINNIKYTPYYLICTEDESCFKKFTLI